jgi:acetamidase/formamidase
MDHHLTSTPGNVHWGLWDGSLKPVLRIASGDRVTIETLSGEPEDMPDPALGFSVVPGQKEVFEGTFRGPGPHFLTGPIYVEGAEPGDVLEVRLLDIKFRADWGWNIQIPFLGTLPDDFPEMRRIHIPLDRARNTATMPWGQDLSLAPFFGNFGVAPAASWGRLSSKEPRQFGGNMDNKELGIGTTTYFPIFAPGALFSAGDGHGLQGDGEVTMGFDEDLDDAVKHALRDMIALICEFSGLSAQDAYTLCSLAADLRVTQMVDGNKGIHCILAKTSLPKR